MSQDGGRKKDRVIHMRVESWLDSELKERASKLGTSVSNLVRDILEHTVGLAEDVIKDSAQVARSVRGEPEPPASVKGSQPAREMGWQLFTLTVNALCERCNAILPKGTEAAITVLDGPGPRPIICLTCAEEERDARSS